MPFVGWADGQHGSDSLSWLRTTRLRLPAWLESSPESGTCLCNEQHFDPAAPPSACVYWGCPWSLFPCAVLTPARWSLESSEPQSRSPHSYSSATLRYIHRDGFLLHYSCSTYSS